MQVVALLEQQAVVHASSVRLLLLILVFIAVILFCIGMTVALLTWRNMRKM